MQKKKFKTIEEYIATFPPEQQEKLSELRQMIKPEAPEAEEMISYLMPAFRLHGNLVYFAAYKNHIGFYPTLSGVEAFKKELSAFETSKGAIRFPIDQPLPHGLVRKIVRFRVKENLAKQKKKK